jgi:putative hydrolase of the HAD superfamily
VQYRAVLFDLGGVVTGSPIHAIVRYERDHGIERNVINRAIVDAGESGAWSRLERGELTPETFFEPFEDDLRARGLDVDARRMMEYIAEAGLPRAAMLEAIRTIRRRGLRTGALTNNWRREAPSQEERPLVDLFDVFIESSVVGLRKPDPRIYRLVCRELGVELRETIFLDDIGRNLKSARALGMTTIKVDEPEAALRELEALLGFPLLPARG